VSGTGALMEREERPAAAPRLEEVDEARLGAGARYTKGCGRIGAVSVAGIPCAYFSPWNSTPVSGKRLLRLQGPGRAAIHEEPAFPKPASRMNSRTATPRLALRLISSRSLDGPAGSHEAGVDLLTGALLGATGGGHGGVPYTTSGRRARHIRSAGPLDSLTRIR
jgi:hypothetical protein